MAQKQNAPGRAMTESVVCLHAYADEHAYTTADLRCQYLERLGISHHRAGLIASLAFGEAAI